MGDASLPNQAEHLQELPVLPGTPASALASCTQTHALSPAALPQPPCTAGSGRLAWEQVLFLGRRLHRRLVQWDAHISCGSTGRSRELRCPESSAPGIKPSLKKNP